MREIRIKNAQMKNAQSRNARVKDAQRAKMRKGRGANKAFKKRTQKRDTKRAQNEPFLNAFLRPFQFLPYTTMGKAKKVKKASKKAFQKGRTFEPFLCLFLCPFWTLYSALYTLLQGVQKHVCTLITLRILYFAHLYLLHI